MTTLNYKGEQFDLMSNLRVAYELQNKNNHKPYTEILSSIDKMHLEDQIGLLWVSFKLANADYVRDTKLKEETFRDTLLNDESFTLLEMMEAIKGVLEGITGKTIDKSDSVEQGNV